VELLEKAVHRDPNFALAYCELANTHIDILHVTGDYKRFEPAKKAAETAVRLRPDLGETHLALARYYFEFAAGSGTNDYDHAHHELTIVRRKLPNNPEALVIDAMIGRHQNRWSASLSDLQRASELDPRNEDILWQLMQIYSEMRLYQKREECLTRMAAIRGTVDNLDIQSARAEIKLEEGDPIAAQSLLEQVPLDYSPLGWVWGLRFKAALYLRDYDAAGRIVAVTPAKWAGTAFGNESSDWAYGQVARARGDTQKMQASFGAARKKLEARLADKSDLASLSDAAKLDAAIGRKNDAIREARHVVEMVPIAKDAVNGPIFVAALALVYAWTGEREQALEQLEKIATIPAGVTYGDLRFNPCWNDLRGDPRFDKIVAAAKAASK
jgi:tetratricopeptide (TPR) repeat protein